MTILLAVSISVLSIPGLGERTAVALIVRMPKLSAGSAARKPPHSPVSRLTTMTAESIKDSDT